MYALRVIACASLVLLFNGCSEPNLEQRIRALPEHPNFQAQPYIAVACDLQALGQQVACETMRKVAAEYWGNQQAIILCRMLFTNRPSGDFRRARIGGRDFLGGTGYSDWPREPVEIVAGVPFYISTRCQGTGQPERPDAYLDYCVTNCIWSSERFAPKDSKAIKDALEKLLASTKWKRPLDAWEREFLRNQAR